MQGRVRKVIPVNSARRGHARQLQRVPLRNGPAYPRAGTARVALFRRLPELLQELGADVDTILASSGVTRADFLEPDNRLPYVQLEQLLLECERRTGCGHFGLLLCEKSRLDDMGLPGRAARCGTTVAEALDALARTYNLSRGGGIIDVVDGDPYVHFVFAIAMGRTRDTRQYQMGAIAIAFNLLEDLCGPEWRATEVRFAFRRPAGVRAFERFFRAPVHFDADESVVVFERVWLDHRLPPVAEPLRRAVAAELRLARQHAFEDFPGLVRDIIRKQRSTGDCSIKNVAATLSLHPRTLSRRLAATGDSYLALQKSVSYEIAQLLLRETDMSVQQVADYLRFSSAANFATAFRQWAGQTPTQFRSGAL